MAFLFVIHVPYIPRAEKQGPGAQKVNGEKTADLEAVSEEDLDKLNESTDEPKQAQEEDGNSSDNLHETEKSKQDSPDIEFDFGDEETVNKTEQVNSDTVGKEDKESETAKVDDSRRETPDSQPGLGFSESEKASQSSITSSHSKNSETSEGKVRETFIGGTKTFDVVKVDDSEIKKDVDTTENGSDTAVKNKDEDFSETLVKDANEGKDDDVGDDGNSSEEKHLTPLVQTVPMHEEVLDMLNQYVENLSQQRVGEDGKLMRISFIKEDSKSCEEILNKLKSLKVGVKQGSSISVFPTSVHESYVEEESSAQSTPTDEKESSMEEKEKESKFKKSIKSRLIVQQVVDAIRGNAAFTFDYLLLVILASLIACMGLVENSSVVLVASMLISPLMGPILAGTFGHVIKKYELRNLGVCSELKGLLLCVFIGFLFGLIAGGVCLHGAVWGSSESWPTIEMKSRGMTRSLWVGVLIAIPSGAGVAIGILGGNAGSLVGVAISASLLPPAVNAGMLWAYALLAAIKPPDVIWNSVITTTTAATISVATPTVNSTEMGNYTSYTPDMTTSTSSPPPLGVPESCLPLVNNNYRQVYSCNISHDAALLGLVSLLLTILNITCIFFMGTVVLWIKEVAPYDSTTSTVINFWHEDVKVARTYYQTSKGADSKTLGQKILNEWQKFKTEQGPKGIPEEQKKLQQNVEIVNCYDFIATLQNDPSIQRITAKLSPSDTCVKVAEGLRGEYQAAKDCVDEQYKKDPAIYLSQYQPKALNKTVDRAYRTIHHVEERKKTSLAELRRRLQKGTSFYDRSSTAGIDTEISQPGKKKTRTTFALLSPAQNKLFKRRKVKFQDGKDEEGENFV